MRFGSFTEVNRVSNELIMTVNRRTIHEVDFCGQVASTVNALCAENPNTFPFQEARLEGFGAGHGRR